MNLNKEIAEILEYFKKGGILTRTLLILGFFITISALTSLSSIVIEWKGFILKGLNFYQLYFVNSVSSIATKVGLHYSVTEIHAATISSISIIVGMRVLAMGQKVAFREINAKYNSEIYPSMRMYWLIGIVAPIGFWIWYGISNPTIRPWQVIFVTVFYPLFLITPKIIMAKFGWVDYEKGHFSYVKSYYAYLAAILIIICALAAVNSGLRE